MTLYERLKSEQADSSLYEKANRYAQGYLKQSFDRAIYPTTGALNELEILDENVPDQPATAHDILDLLHNVGSPNTVILNGGRYFGFVNGGITPASIATKWLADVWDQNTAMDVMSPICGKLEIIVERWLQELFNLPKTTVAGFVTGTSMASYCGLIAAREHAYKSMNYDLNNKGMAGAPPLRIITSSHTHGSINKAISMLGFGLDNVEYVPCDNQGRLLADQLPTLDKTCIVILQAGNVNSGSFDPIDDVCETANKAGAWVHIDGAFGLWAEAVPQLSYLTKGLEKADSWSVDGHKTLNTPYDCGIIMCKHKASIISALHASGDYLMLDKPREGMLYTTDMSRRNRIVDLWSTIKCLGRSGIEEMIYTFHLRAKQFAEEITEAGFHVPNDIVFNQVIVHCDNDENTAKVLQDVQDQRVCWCGASTWFGKPVIRVSVCAWTTTEEDISKSVLSFKQALAKVNT
jgi:glutamate/tyrosine decarboxylase-like PLP-dependent enzyme